MTWHNLKCWENSFAAVESGRKKFEWRKDDRGFEVGDVLVLHRYNPEHKCYVDRYGLDTERADVANTIQVRVTYILRGSFEMTPGYCVLSIELMGES